jgi:hypothetical protein
LNSVPVADRNEPVAVTTDPRGGTLAARWTPAQRSPQHLTLQSFDLEGRPRSEPITVRTVTGSDFLHVAIGADTRGRVLLLWTEPGLDTWVGQWLRLNGRALTRPFAVPLPENGSPDLLRPLIGGGLVLRSGAAWVLRFPSGEAQALPAPDWLVAHPDTDLVLIRNGRAYALVPPPILVHGSGCRESLLLFSEEGAACGEFLLPFGGSICAGRRIGIALDGTVIQQIELNIPANDQCAWRWWSRLLR